MKSIMKSNFDLMATLEPTSAQRIVGLMNVWHLVETYVSDDEIVIRLVLSCGSVVLSKKPNLLSVTTGYHTEWVDDVIKEDREKCPELYSDDGQQFIAKDRRPVEFREVTIDDADWYRTYPKNPKKRKENQ